MKTNTKVLEREHNQMVDLAYETRLRYEGSLTVFDDRLHAAQIILPHTLGVMSIIELKSLEGDISRVMHDGNDFVVYAYGANSGEGINQYSYIDIVALVTGSTAKASEISKAVNFYHKTLSEKYSK